MEKKEFIQLKDLQVYQLARQLSAKAWEIYQKMDYWEKRNIGDQFIRSSDSVGANIAEGYHRFNYYDKARFYYYSRASMAEALDHWAELLYQRGLISEEEFSDLVLLKHDLQVRLNNFIKATKNGGK
jgi:four helix bundle protein